MTKGVSEAMRTQVLAGVPLGRLGSPAEVAAAITFLCSDEAGYITGETLRVNGGMLS
jgi:NAD(P)-dependent dehydrogenase (short-subunit alcohol dehydrogenase family)